MFDNNSYYNKNIDTSFKRLTFLENSLVFSHSSKFHKIKLFYLVLACREQEARKLNGTVVYSLLTLFPQLIIQKLCSSLCFGAPWKARFEQVFFSAVLVSKGHPSVVSVASRQREISTSIRTFNNQQTPRNSQIFIFFVLS